MTRTAVAIASAALMLSACHAPSAEDRTKHYFQQHDAERADVIDKCKNSDREYRPAEECANALRAQRQVEMDHDTRAGPR